ncbi:MAG: nucleotidyltransferase family protein [Lentisphaerae bacterium]|nr:nucleotidyltransferase family protein [Lentisphaerota bacterium]
MSIESVFEVVAENLPKVGVDFLMIGGHAVNYYGYVRATMDVDFMIAASDVANVREVMKLAGFTNISESENVVFFSRPESSLRVDFLPVDASTMEMLLERSVVVDYAGSSLRIPCLEDLVAMKLFALKNGSPKRRLKDSEDVVQLVVEYDWSVENQLKPLCLRFADKALFEELSARIKEERNA